MELATIIGLVAITFSILGYVPQVVKSWKTREAGDISLPMILILILSLSAWFAYGLLVENLPLILANAASLSLVLLLFTAKLKYGYDGLRKD
ncbi:hypothetical protein AKJ64_04870 [candidate division MSBL1 archaeon SCGC-AAA259E17]|uniref:MtN3 and saliva related transmembrane protein n=1 Tax=candidate division MSBL1 archaeon SCGC-AAA259E17 TaxID=1698263 RepID=A0A133UAK4_9EURY|nr:hypothetical protein AKJ64_04870 [candidate division MSBL1 archaeon SCGC-AAA259E17]